MHTFILSSSLLYAVLALIWQRTTLLNLIFKVAFLLMAIWGFAIVLTGSGVVQ